MSPLPLTPLFSCISVISMGWNSWHCTQLVQTLPLRSSMRQVFTWSLWTSRTIRLSTWTHFTLCTTPLSSHILVTQSPLVRWWYPAVCLLPAYYTVSQKVPTFKLSVTLLKLNQFSKFLHWWKAYEICYKKLKIFCHYTMVMLIHNLGKSKVQIC